MSPSYCHRVRSHLHGVVERHELCSRARAVFESPPQNVVGQPRVAWQQRAVQVRAARPQACASFVAAHPAIAVAREYCAEGRGASPQLCAARMIFKSSNLAGLTVEGGVDQHVADQARVPRDGVGIEQPDTGHA